MHSATINTGMRSVIQAACVTFVRSVPCLFWTYRYSSRRKNCPSSPRALIQNFHPPIGDRHRPPTKPPGGESSGGCLCHDHGRIGLTSTGLRSCRGYCHRDCGCPLSLCAHLLRRCRYNNHRHCLLRRQHHHLRWTRRAREHQRTCRKCNPDHLPFLCNTQH